MCARKCEKCGGEVCPHCGKTLHPAPSPGITYIPYPYPVPCSPYPVIGQPWQSIPVSPLTVGPIPYQQPFVTVTAIPAVQVTGGSAAGVSAPNTWTFSSAGVH